MPQIAPFRAVRYAAREPETLGRCIAPPYDVISPAQREMYAARETHNVVHLILPQELAGDDATHNRYQRAGVAYRQWLSDGTLARDAAPAIYALQQGFRWGGKRYQRRGFFARLGLRPFSDGIVLPHERTLSGPKADRLNLFRAVKANLSPIFGLIDDRGEVQRALEQPGDAEVTVQGDDGAENALWPIRDRAVLAAIVETLGPRKTYIADGHHRYETGLAYAAEIDAARGGGARRDRAHHSILAYFCSTSDPGLIILPTHRVLRALPDFEAERLVRRLEDLFDLQKLERLELEVARERLAAAGAKRPAFLMAAGRETWLLGLKAGVDLAAAPELTGHAAVRELDVSVLHGLILQRLLGLSPQSQVRQENLEYVKDAREAFRSVESGAAQLAFVLNATRMEQVRAVAEAGDVMPQKSTFFYPKLPSGLLFNPLDPEELFPDPS